MSPSFIMASRYIQEFPVPNDFPSVFKNLTKEILRDQPTNILHYAASYFHALQQQRSFIYNPDFKFDDPKDESAPSESPKEQPPSGVDNVVDNIIENTIDQVYTQFDKNNDGSLDLEELRKMVLAMKESGAMPMEKEPTDEDLKGLLGDLDSNGNGKVQRSQFKAFIKKVSGL